MLADVIGITSYTDGTPIHRVADHFGIHRSTIFDIIERAGIEHRTGVINRNLEEARHLYEKGWSLAKVGQRLGVNGETVRQAFSRAELPRRPRRGWKR